MHCHGTGRSRRLGCAILALLVGGGGAAAADRGPPQAAVDWSGFYAGGQLGGAWNAVDWTQVNANYFNMG